MIENQSDNWRRMYGNTEPWENNVPADLISAIKHIRESFDEAHWGCGRTTQAFCYAGLHYEALDDPAKEYFNYLMFIKVRVGSAATQRFHDLLKQGTPPAIFKGFFDLYLDGLSIQVFIIFKELVEIGRANEKRLGIPHLEWAESQTKYLIRSENHRIEMWVRDVCDKQLYNPNEDREESIFWRKWQAPMLVVMKPSRNMPYDAATVWERNDTETSLRLLKMFTEHYVLHLENKLKKAAGEAAVKLAKLPKPMQNSAVSGDPQQENLPNAPAPIQQQVESASTADPRYTPSNHRREARKLDTQDMHKSWQKAYRSLKQSRPEMSDVWCSQQIAKMDIAQGRNAETIRKHMHGQK
jgi:hypothetical protein